MAPLRQVAVALDWTPNTNHAGFYIAKAKGWYAEAGLDVVLLSPHADDYKETPASKLLSGAATFALTPSETVVSFHTNRAAPKPKLVAVAAALQTSASAIVTLKSSGIERPAQLDGKRYASYAARYEGRIVQQMIKNDGGQGDYQELVLPMLGAPPALPGLRGLRRQAATGGPLRGRWAASRQASRPRPARAPAR
jgi:ABC-type nitrate/sulfonate/bicarbonate transport system substrate-binding protein